MGDAVQSTQSFPCCLEWAPALMASVMWGVKDKAWPAGDPPTPTSCSWQEPELPLNLSAMGEMEQLRQEAEQLKKQIAVTPEPSLGDPRKLGTGDMRKCGLGGRRLGSLLSDTLETPDLEVTRDFLKLDLIFEMSPNCRAPNPPASEAHEPPTSLPYSDICFSPRMPEKPVLTLLWQR